MRIGSLFSGIGGLELGLEMSGIGHVVWQVEQNPFCQKVLAKHWSHVERFEDVKEVGKHNLNPIDLICGGFPCQDISSAGKGAGLAGSRSGLWFEYLRIIKELRPAWVVVENVASGARRWVDPVISCLDESGYETLPVPLSAKDVGAPHLRKRVFLIARDTNSNREPVIPIDAEVARMQGVAGPSRQNATNTLAQGLQNGGVPLGVHSKLTEHTGDPWGQGPTFSPVCGVDDGVSNRVERVKALGNAVVPQCAEVIGHIIQELINR